VPVNELTLDIACDGILALQKAVSLKKHRNIIDEYRGISGNKELSVSAVYETLDGVKDTLQKVDADLFNSITGLFENYGAILVRLQISENKLNSLSRLNNLAGIETDIWRWIQLHYKLSKTQQGLNH